MSTSTQSRRHSRGLPQPPFHSYDLAQSSRSRVSIRKQDDVFDTLFPQPPPRSRVQAERLARPSLPSLKPSHQLDSANSSRSTAHFLSSSNSIESVNSLSSYPSSTSSLSLLHGIHSYKQASIDSSIDYYSPAVSDVNSAETDHSASSGHAHSQSSDVEAQDQSGPLTPLTPNGATHAWRPKQLNLVRKRHGNPPIEPSLPSYRATSPWNSTSAISGDRNALLIGLGLGDIGLNPEPAPPSVPTGLPADRLMQSARERAFLHSRSPQLGNSATFSREGQSNTTSEAPQGPKQLLLVSSAGPPAVRRFPGRRPSEGIHEPFTPALPPPETAASSRCTTPQMRPAIPIMPNGPAFVDPRAPSPDPSLLLAAQTERQSGISAQEFLAQIASTPEYQASKYFESTLSAWPSGFGRASTGSAITEQDDFQRPLNTAVSNVAVAHSDDRDESNQPSSADSMHTGSSATTSPGPSVLATKAPGFSSTQRSRAASLSRRKAPPTPLVLASSPSTSNSDTLSVCADGRRRRSLAATTSQRSPLSAAHSGQSSISDASPQRTPISAATRSSRLRQESVSDYSEPLRTAFYDFESEEDADKCDDGLKPSNNVNARPTESPTRSIREDGSIQAQRGRNVALDRVITESPASRHSVLSSPVSSLRSLAQSQKSSGSDLAPAFEFVDLETESPEEGLSLQTMMGFLQRQHSIKASSSSRVASVESELDEQQVAQMAADFAIKQEKPSKNGAEARSPLATSFLSRKEDKQASSASPAPEVPRFNMSIFGPREAVKAKAPPLRNSVNPSQNTADGESAIAPPSPGAGITRSRKQSMVPAPPSFAIRIASRHEPSLETPSLLLPTATEGLDTRPVLVRAPSSETPGNSRWSSGSESDGESALSTKAGRKSFSKSRKSFSSSRKNSVAIARELITPNTAREVVPDVSRKQSKRSSKNRLSAQGAAVQALPIPAMSSTTSMSKRLLLNGLPGLRKKSFSSLSGQSASPSTPSSARATPSADPAFLDKTEFPFPPSATPKVMTSPPPPVPNVTSQPHDSDGITSTGLTTQSAFASNFASVSQMPVQSPRTPISAPKMTASERKIGPLTTQQILAQARSNVWPENYIGNSVSAAGMASPYLASAQDAFSYNLAPSRLAPTPPHSASRGGWASAPHTPPIPQSPRMPNAAFMDKTLPAMPLKGAMGRSRSRTAELVEPPKNLRHMRQSSSNTSLDKMRMEVPADLFKLSASNAMLSSSEIEQSMFSPRLDTNVAEEERLSAIAETFVPEHAVCEEMPEPIEVKSLILSIPVLVARQQAKLKKALRIRKQQERFARRNSWSECGLQWVADLGMDAFNALADEGLPSSAILAAAGAPTSRSNRMLAGGSGGDGDGNSDGSDTDDYGSSDGGGGAGGFGGAGGGGGGKHPGQGRNGADDSDEEEEEESDEDEEEAGAMTDQDSEDDYGELYQSAAGRSARGGAVPAVPARKASMPTSRAGLDDAADSDSTDDRPLGMLVDDPKALQKALRAQERKRHFALAAQALEGKPSSDATPSTGSHARQAVQGLPQAHTADGVLNPNDLTQRLARVQGRRERAHAPHAGIMQRSQTVARQDAARQLERAHQANAVAVSRSKSVRTGPAERYVHPGMRARTPSEAALRAKATAQAQAMPTGSSSGNFTLPNAAKMPDLPSHAMATVVAAQKAMAHAQANPSPAAVAQAQALATSATAALKAATALVKKESSSPISPSFNHGEPIGHVAISPRVMDGVELPGARLRSESRGHALPAVTSAAPGVAAPAVASNNPVGMFQRLRSRSVSRQQAPLTINTAALPAMPELPRPRTGSKDSQASGSPRSVQQATFAAVSQAAMHHERPSVDIAAANEASVQRAPSAHPSNMSHSHDSSISPGALASASPEPLQSHKVYILSRQRFTLVEVPVSARARDLALEVIERERLPTDDSKGGWVVFDCSAQLGIERPLREYEMVADVVNVRAHPKTDFFVMKRTELSPYLSIRSVPISSPSLAGHVYVQDRKKKWSKRWLELRDHGLYHAKNEKGKDEMSICQISTFDIYLVDSSAVKMPKANGFALRSQDQITMFEKPDQDYIHYFCLTDPAAHRDWVRAILNARTYILRQEKAVLFQIDSPPSSQEPPSAAMVSGGLSRKNTSRRPNPRSVAQSETGHNTGITGPSPPTPLIDSNAFAGPFAKGSLLADKAIHDAKEALRGHAAVALPTGAMNDLSLMDRNAMRMNEARRREEAIERQRKMKTDGQPLIDLARK
ncbi:uncharacterized protein MEPE_04368 [Melanopsichium pennsylvanicum]|uniref:PH domain-containing protein n=2 Tax=Melanopsichium pennsylvanicum TaxID=63383 RepID=A0AAJ4XMN0_9BASI|nr:ra domain-containing protein [Melanopsichium pennsylvanicum 4]SNX85659.1 uncharacterized protein MEPE_04368 [Melanopsichium pennsylvanicum]